MVGMARDRESAARKRKKIKDRVIERGVVSCLRGKKDLFFYERVGSTRPWCQMTWREAEATGSTFRKIWR
jgi:hypothetical protein